MPPCRLMQRKFGKFDYEMVHSEEYLNEYVLITSSPPPRPPIQKTALFACFRFLIFHPFFSALTLLVGWQEGHPACKKLSSGVLAWLSVWSEVQICI